MSLLITPVPGSPQLRERVVARESPWASRKIALLDIDGVLHNSRDTSLLGVPGENPVSLLKEKLDLVAKDARVKAVVLRINSPGGGVTASDLMYSQVRAFRERTRKPVIAAILDVGASGAYYISCGCDEIFATPTSITGSIGVISIRPDLTGTMDKIGVSTNVFKSGPFKDAGSPLREMTEQDRAIFQRMIDEMYARFVNVVAQGRPNLSQERVRALADGRVYTAGQALADGLIDHVGSLEDAIGSAKRRAGLGHRPVMVVEYARPLSYEPNIYSRGPGPPTQVNLVNIGLPDWLRPGTPQLLYLWTGQ